MGLLLLAYVIFYGITHSELEASAPTPLLRDRHGRFLAELGEGDLGFWQARPLPRRVVAATLALEDRRFWQHPGVDPVGIARSVVQNLSHGRRVSGASTLAMQVARMQSPGSRNLWRKGLEAVTALFLTARHGREALLEHYLRIVPYGNRYHGIAYAARRYLDKPVEDLSWAETAFLTAIPQAPGRMNPYTFEGSRRAVARGKRILAVLFAWGAMSRAELDLALQQIDRLTVLPKGERPWSAMHAVLRLKQRLGEEAGGASPLVDTRIDLEVQEAVAARVSRAVERWEADGAGNAAVMVVDRHTFEVVASVGSTGYFDARHKGSIDYTRVQRLPGSALKPFLYALALERGLITPASVVDDLDRGPNAITNADDLYLGPLLPRVALANSRNVPAVELLNRLGLEEGYAFLRELEIYDGSRPASYFGLGMAIGGIPVTLEQLVRAYTVLADDGRLRDLLWYDGQTTRPPRRLLSEATARQLALFLSDPQARLPSFPRMGASEYPFPVALKTGTSSNYHDAWTVAWSSRYLAGVWVGHPDYRPMRMLSGYKAGAQLAREVLVWLHRDQFDGMHDLSFPPPRGFVASRLCPLSGRLAGEACDRVTLEWLEPSQVPSETCHVHVRLAIDTRTGTRATGATPRRFTTVQTFVDLPARYAAWATAARLPRPPLEVSTLAGQAIASSGPSTAPSSPGASAAPSPSDVSAAPSTSGSSAGLSTSGASAAPSTSAPTPAAPLLTAGRPVRLRITAPEHRSVLVRDPESPAGSATLALGVVVDPPVEQVVWYVDGQPWRVVDYPYNTRWPMQPGEHTFQARVPYTRAVSATVRVTLQ